MDVSYKPQLPEQPTPICLIGAGSIVKDAHLPAYRIAGFPVAGITDLVRAKAEALAAEFGIDLVYDDTEAMVADHGSKVVYDIALPASACVDTLRILPDGAAVLMQKPMGESIADAGKIQHVCREKKLKAAVNFQLRFAPFVMAARDLIDRGLIGNLHDLEFRVSVYTPWDHFPFLKTVPRLEIVYHSIHYIDCARSFLGNPERVMANSIKHPELMELPESRSTIIMDYGNRARVNIETNHFHKYGPKHQESFIKWEGSRGAIKAKMGLLMNYPEGVPDVFEYCLLEDGKEIEWKEISLEGSWFPHAFVGSMSQVMRLKEGSENSMPTNVEDAFCTMACVEAAYDCSECGGVAVGKYLEGAGVKFSD